MVELAEGGGGDDSCPIEFRTIRCSKCDNESRINKKLNWVSRWSWRPRTWVHWTVFFLSTVNIVFAHFSSSPGDGNSHYSSQWAVHIKGGQEEADKIAAKHGFVNLGKIFEDFYHFEHRLVQKRSTEPHLEYHANLLNETQVKWAQQQIVKKRSKRDLVPLRLRSKSSMVRFNDVEWPQMWYLNRGQGLDMNVEGAWLEGISGKGVVVTILDDGLEKTHPDLVGNYDPQASYDVNNHDEDPMPRYDAIDSNRHGTRCAGEVAAVANNSLCSVGVAFGASVGGVRMLDGDVTDAVEARSLSLNPQHIDIYSASWGPDDDGKTVDGPGELATRAFIEGVTKGRQGKGSIFVWASGNGGREHDNCNCDGYTNSIWTLSISSATENGLVPWYSEACSSTLATTYSSGSVREKQIVTTDLRHKCTNGHTGTSASAPLAAGICALALEANRELTWRDMQHIVVRTARPANLKSPDWKVNGVGRNVSHSFGYGLMDATAMVKLARIWKTVPEQHRCEVSAPHVDKPIPPRSKVILNLNVTECVGVNFLEHVQAKISLSSSRRGDLQIYLTSPAGTRSTLLARRPQDSSRNPFNAWPFMSVHTWGEMPFGEWQLEIHNEGRYLGRANLQEWSLLFYGTSQMPTGMPDETPLRIFATKSPSNKPNTVHFNSKANKNSFGSSNLSNRKNPKNWKTKSTSSRLGKLLNGSRVSNTSKSFPTASPKNFKSTQRFWYLNKIEAGLPRALPPTTSIPSSTHNMPLTIVLGPSGNFNSHQKVPDVFQKYPKVQQLFPLYVNTGRIYNEENFLIPKVDYASSKAQDYMSKPKGTSFLSVQKTERQNRFDTSSLIRTDIETKTSGNTKQLSRNQQGNQGHFEGWQMLLYGTEDTPNGESHPSENRNNGGKPKVSFPGKVNIEDEVPNYLDSDPASRGGWKDQATRRDDVMRTTTDPLGGPSSGCISISKSSSQCVECVSGMYLYVGRCEANCPPKTYPGINGKERAACMPCHYTCLTCAGESEGHCISCHDEAVPIPSGMQDTTERKPNYQLLENLDEGNPDIKIEDLPEESPRFSWGKRNVNLLVTRNSVLTKKAVTKKILEPYDSPRSLYYCYPARVIQQMQAASWFRKMSILFSVNIVILFSILMYFLCNKLRARRLAKKKFQDITFRYSKMTNGDSGTKVEIDSIFNISSSSDEE